MGYADQLDMMDDDCDIQGFPLDDGKDMNVTTKWIDWLKQPEPDESHGD